VKRLSLWLAVSAVSGLKVLIAGLLVHKTAMDTSLGYPLDRAHGGVMAYFLLAWGH
jgi:hypothetical protein